MTGGDGAAVSLVVDGGGELGDREGVPSVVHFDGRQDGLSVGRPGLGFAELGAGAGDGRAGSGVSSGNFGSPNRYLSLSSFIAAAASVMNWRQIGPAWLAPKISPPPPLAVSGAPSVVPSQTAAPMAPV